MRGMHGMPNMFEFLFSAKGFGSARSEAADHFLKEVVELTRNILFLGFAVNEEKLSAYLDKEISDGKYFGTMLERGQVLLPRLKKWISDCYCIATLNFDIHRDFYETQVARLYI